MTARRQVASSSSSSSSSSSLLRPRPPPPTGATAAAAGAIAGHSKNLAIMIPSAIKAWSVQEKYGLRDFVKAQCQIAIVLSFAYFGNIYEPSYPRNDNHSPSTFWFVNSILLLGSLATWTWKASTTSRTASTSATSATTTTATTPRIVLLGREQTEEWKGWMQYMFIFYHYYRAYAVYNEIRVFVSAYVWMTGFGNFLYFDKKADYSIERFVSMILRINYFPLLLSYFLSVPLELYYVVPLHTTGFVVAMITCYLGYTFEGRMGMSYWTSRSLAISLSLVAHVLFYETPAVDFLLYFSKEYHFRFQSDKYSAWLGMACGLLWGKVGEYMQWAHGYENDQRRRLATIVQLFVGLCLIGFWYGLFGHIGDKFVYNPVHPYVFIFALVGWLLMRNCTRYLTECHSSLLEFLGRHTLETYVLQFHLFMSHNVQHIPVIIPGSDAESGSTVLKFANMVLCGTVFLTMAVWARKITVTTQSSVVELVKKLSGGSTDAVEYSAVSQEQHSLVDNQSGGGEKNGVELTKLEDGTTK